MASRKVGIISIGEMGVGIAKLLQAHGYIVMTNITGRSEYTSRRAAAAGIIALESDEELVRQVDYVFSIVPPRDAVATARRIIAVQHVERDGPLYYVDLNAVSPGLIGQIYDDFKQNAPAIKFVDGGIIGGPPRLKDDGSWARPGIPLSGPDNLPDARLLAVLNTSYLGARIGSASGLKCCYGSMLKGLIAISIQSFSTAHALGVYDEMQRLLKTFQPALQESTTRMVTEIPPKASRWVEEMVEIGKCFNEEGGWDNVKGVNGADIYERVAEVYRAVAEQTVLGEERPEHRKRGTTAEDVSAAVIDGLRPKNL